MKITKSKNYSILTSTLTRVKEHNNISSDDSTFDGIIKFKLGAAIDYAENFCRSAIVPQTCTLIDESYLVPIPAIYFKIPESNNVVISAITIYDYAGNATVINSTKYRVEHNSNFTLIYFNPSITYYKIQIVYTSGYSNINQIPFAVQEAINVLTAYLFQADRQGILPNGTFQSNLAERYLSSYVNL